MEGLMSNQVIALIGPPGSGKDTQAMRLAEEYEVVQVPSSQIIRKKFAENPNDPVIIREKQRLEEGFLTDPTLVAKWIMEFVYPLAEQGTGLIFSGSPRTPPEARHEFTELLRLYGPRNVRVIHVQLSEEESLRRIAGRRFCRENAHPVPGTPEFAHMTVCPKDGSPLERRPLDDPEKQALRFKEYRELTEPCLAVAAECGVAVFEVDGSKTIESIHHDIVGIVERHKLPVSEQ